jgi:hypothetical protein
MKVFVPHQKDRNIYLDEIINFSNNTFIFGNYEDYESSYEIVNIQFPEAIFAWIAPNAQQLANLEIKLQLWKEHSKVVLTMNDLQKHYDNKNDFLDLFRLIHKYADGVIHLGQYSLDQYKECFSSNCLHTIIYHPLYSSLVTELETSTIGKTAPIALQDKFIVSAIGDIRSREEIKLILKIFEKLPIKNKVLVVPRMFQFVKIPDYIPYRFRKVYKKIIERFYSFPLSKSQYYFSGRFLDYPHLVDLVQRSSLMIIPRVKNLNSGNLFLGLTFDKLMVIPKIGNLTEVANFLEVPLLDLEKRNYDEVIKNILNSKLKQYFVSKEYLVKKELFHPKKIAKDYEVFFNLIITHN